MIEGYKFFNEDFKSDCGNIQYEVGKTHTYKYGFKISRKLKDAFSYGHEDAKYCCKIEGNGEIIGGHDIYSEIYIKEELNFNDVLKKLSKDEDYCVRRNVAKNKNCPIDILRKLSKDEDWHVRIDVVKNKNCPEDILRKLSEDEDSDVRDAAKKQLKNENDLINNRDVKMSDTLILLGMNILQKIIEK